MTRIINTWFWKEKFFLYNLFINIHIFINPNLWSLNIMKNLSAKNDIYDFWLYSLLILNDNIKYFIYCLKTRTF